MPQTDRKRSAAALLSRWRPAECFVLRDTNNFARAVVVKGKYDDDWEWFAGQKDGLKGSPRKAKNAAIEAIALADQREVRDAAD